MPPTTSAGGSLGGTPPDDEDKRVKTGELGDGRSARRRGIYSRQSRIIWARPGPVVPVSGSDDVVAAIGQTQV